jgi:hypothetical protein
LWVPVPGVGAAHHTAYFCRGRGSRIRAGAAMDTVELTGVLRIITCAAHTGYCRCPRPGRDHRSHWRDTPRGHTIWTGRRPSPLCANATARMISRACVRARS